MIPLVPLATRTRVKMCGTTRLEDAQFAARLGVDALGFIFVRKSPRYISPDKAHKIAQTLPPFIDRVGVFVNSPLPEIEEIVTKAKLSFVQLHGDESPDFCTDFQQKQPHCKILKAFRLGTKSEGEEFSPYNECVDGFLLDTYVKGSSGGTGKVFDWSIIDTLQLRRPVILAGGLTPENCADAIRLVSPYGIDINSGVEIKPGIKDHDKLGDLMSVVARKNTETTNNS